MLFKKIDPVRSFLFFLFLTLLLLQACSYPTTPRIGKTPPAPEGQSASSPPQQTVGEIFQKEAPPLASQPERKAKQYEIGPEDWLEIRVWDQEDLTREVYVSREGDFSYPLIGKVQASGLSVEQLEKEIAGRLSGQYLVNPQVTVIVKEFRSQKVMVMGEVGSPGSYTLTGKTTLMEILTKAGGPTKEAGTEVTVMRHPKTASSASPQERSANDEVIKVNLIKLLEGDTSQNVYLEPNDTVYVSKIASYYVFGEVGSPGKYNLEIGTTVLKAITTAGGVTEKAAVNRTKVVREKGGQKLEMRVKLTDPVEPEDVIVVPESFF